MGLFFIHINFTYVFTNNIACRVQPVFEKYKEHADIEIQQRACEYAAINGNPDSKVIESVFEVMPIFEGEAQNALIKKAEKKSRRRSVGGETKEDNDVILFQN